MRFLATKALCSLSGSASEFLWCLAITVLFTSISKEAAHMNVMKEFSTETVLCQSSVKPCSQFGALMKSINYLKALKFDNFFMKWIFSSLCNHRGKNELWWVENGHHPFLLSQGIFLCSLLFTYAIFTSLLFSWESHVAERKKILTSSTNL